MTVTLIVSCNKLGILLWCTTENIKKLNWTVLTLCGYQGSFKLFNFFLRKDFAHTKSTEKHKKAQKSTKEQRRNQAKAQNATSEH